MDAYSGSVRGGENCYCAEDGDNNECKLEGNGARRSGLGIDLGSAGKSGKLPGYCYNFTPNRKFHRNCFGGGGGGSVEAARPVQKLTVSAPRTQPNNLVQASGPFNCPDLEISTYFLNNDLTRKQSDLESAKKDVLEESEQKSFNYDDISLHSLKVAKDELRNETNNKTTRVLDDVTALDLHDSKSYIVSLIDKALSKELGTIPEGNIISQKFDSQVTKKMIESLKIEQEKNQEEVQDSCKSCACKKDIFLKQLKQLKYGHLRHILHETKQLEELERFIDFYQSSQ